MHSSKVFGGKVVVVGGDFRQILLIIPKGSRAEIVDAVINSSFIWHHCRLFKLTKNMRLNLSQSNAENERINKFSEWLLNIGDGNIGLPHDGITEIDILPKLLVKNFSNPLDAIVQASYPNLLSHLGDSIYLIERAILAPTLEVVQQINSYVSSLLPGENVDYYSSDSICKSDQDSDSFVDLHSTEFLNTINCSGVPPHNFTLKIGVPIMLLRNIDQANGLCNGTRLCVTQLGKYVIKAMGLNGSNAGEEFLIHRMDMNPSESRFPFTMRRRKFPIVVSFVMTNDNK